MTVDHSNPTAPRRQVELHATGLVVPDANVVGGRRFVAFSEVDHLLLSSEYVLSFQVGYEIFSVRLNPQSPKNGAVLEKLVATLRAHSGAQATG